MTISNLRQRVEDLTTENQHLRNSVNDIKENEEVLKTEVGQYKLHLERIKRDQANDKHKKDSEKDELLEEANKLIENFNAEKHLIKAKIKALLIEYCDLDEDSYKIDDDIDMDEYLEKLEKELKGYTERVKEESMDKITKIMYDLETAQQQQNTLGNEIDMLRKENEELIDQNQILEDENQTLKRERSNLEATSLENLKGKKEAEKAKFHAEKNYKLLEQTYQNLESQITDYESNFKANEDKVNNLEVDIINKDSQIKKLESQLQSSNTSFQPEDSHKVEDLTEEINKLQDQVIELSEKLKFTEKELTDERERQSKERISKSEKLAASKPFESSRESDDAKEYFERIDVIERRVDQIKIQIGKVMVESFDHLKQMYELKHQEYIKKVESQLIEADIKEKGIVNILKELKGIGNDSIRVLKCVNNEDKIWYLIEEDYDVDISREEEPTQYWIRESDLTIEEREYLYQFTPSSGIRDLEDTGDYIEINKRLKSYSTTLKELRDERKDLLKELREIRFGLKITYYCINEDFDEDAEQKLHDYDIKFIEYEDDITYLNENLEEQKLMVNELMLK